MTPSDFRRLVQEHHARAVQQGRNVPVFSPGEQLAFDLYRALRDDAKHPLKRVLTSVIDSRTVDSALIAVRARITAFDITGTCDREVVDSWRSLEATLVMLYELCTGAPETGDEEQAWNMTTTG